MGVVANIIRIVMLLLCAVAVTISFDEHSQLFLETGYRLSMLATASAVTMGWIDEVRRGV